MPDTFVLRSSRVITPHGERPAAVIIRGGLIADVVDPDHIPVSCRIEDVGSRVVMPGLVDTHVHINEPGRADWEGFETATQAAAAGGITTLVDMPLNSSPVTVTVAALKQKIAAAQGKLFVDCGFHGGLVPGHERDVEALLDAGVIGIKAFLVHSGIDEFPAAGEKELAAVMPVLARRGIPLLVHAEIDREKPDLPAGGPDNYRRYLASRPNSWENDAVKMMIHLCREYECPVHIVHLSSAEALEDILKARIDGLRLTVETCPHYLYFRAEEIPDGETRFKCTPPIRDGENNSQLWDALHAGFIDMICTNHSPCPPEMRKLDEGDLTKAWGGIASLQLSLSIAWTAARQAGALIEDVARWVSSAPARLAGLDKRKGAIAKGYDADLVVFEPDATFKVETGNLYHRHKITPYEGRTLYGVVERTYLRGRKIGEGGIALAGAGGQVLRRPS
ncbi:MAG: allantoinase AllB [bacterium]